MSRLVKIFDTTLRDGEQAPGYSMNMEEKLELARQLELLGVDVIEAGFANSSSEDFESIKAISKIIKKAAVCSLSRLTKKDIDRAWEAVKEAPFKRIHTFIATSDVHMQYKLKMTRDEVLKNVREMVRYASGLCEDVEFSAEDALRSDREFLAQVVRAAIESGACTINLPDTVGYTTPNEMFDLIRYMKENIEGIDKIDLSVHCHNDLGLGVANSIAGVMAGASQIECTVGGIGERAGNAALEEIAMALDTRKNYYEIKSGINTKQIYRTCKLLSTITGMPINPNKPIVGGNAFSHEAGIHQHGVMMQRSTYEIMKPETIGIYQNKMVLGKHSGKHAFEERLKDMGYTLSPEDLQKAFENFKDLTDKKRVVSDRDLEALVGIEHFHEKGAYRLEGFSVQSGSSFSAVSAVKLSKNGELFEDASLGDGPIDAAFKAIDRITGSGGKLINYTIQSVTEGEDALGEVVAKLESESGLIVTGRGLSTDIIEASIKAYLNGVNKILQKKPASA